MAHRDGSFNHRRWYALAAHREMHVDGGEHLGVGVGALGLQLAHDALDARDRLDKERPIAPLRQAEDAVYLDSSSLTIREATDRVLELAISRGATLV
mgnify:CR=1 FL=1